MSSAKQAYTITCSSEFRDQVLRLASKKKVNVGDLARSIILSVPPETIDAAVDPGEPGDEDRESVVLKSGPSEGKPWQRKPRLQARLPKGLDIAFIRKALNVALSMEQGEYAVALEKPEDPRMGVREFHDMQDQLEKLKTIVSVLSFEPLPHGVKSRQDALYVLGFHPFAHPDDKLLRNRFRMLATIHHPDTELGSHRRMSQLNEAVAVLKRH